MTQKGILTEIKTKKTKNNKKHKNILTAKFSTRLILTQWLFFFFFEISKIQGYIAQSNKEKLEKEKEIEIKEQKEKLKKLETQNKKKINKKKTQQVTKLVIILEK